MSRKIAKWTNVPLSAPLRLHRTAHQARSSRTVILSEMIWQTNTKALPSLRLSWIQTICLTTTPAFLLLVPIMTNGARRQKPNRSFRAKLTGITKEIIRSPEKAGNVRQRWITLILLPEMSNFRLQWVSVSTAVQAVCTDKRVLNFTCVKNMDRKI